MTKKRNSSHRSKNIPFSWYDTNHNPVRGETALWVAVITQAMMDALSRSDNKEAQYHKHEATHWLTENSKDFIEVCLSAGLDPDNVRRKAKRTLANPTLWRAAAGTGSRYEERKKYRLKLKARKEKNLLIPTITSEEKNSSPCIIAGPWL